MPNVPGALPRGLDTKDFGPAVPTGGGESVTLSAVTSPAPSPRIASALPEGLNAADFGQPVDTYRPAGSESLPTNPLYGALTRARGVSPDHVADVLKLSRRTGLDVGAVERNLPEAKSLAEFEPTQIDAFMQRNPKATAWLRDPANFGLAKDDLDALGGVEQAFARSSMGGVEQEESGGIGSSALKTVKRTIPTLGKGLYDVYGLGAGVLDYAERGLGDLLGTGSTGVFGQGRDYFHGQAGAIADNILSQPGLSLPKSKQGRLWDNPRLLLDPEWLTFNVGDAANSMLPTIASLFLSGGATAVPAVVGAMQEAGDLYHQLITEDKADPDRALSAALGFGVVVGQLEKFGLDKIMDKRVASTFAKRIAKATVAGASEGASEWVEEPFQAFFQGMANNESPEQVTARVAESLKNVDVIPGAFILGGAGAYGNTAHEYHKAKAAQRMGTAFDEISKLSGESKLNARLPEAYQEYVEHVRRETNGAVPEQVYVSAQRLAEAVVETGASGGDGSVQADAQVLAQFFQSIGIAPEDAQRMAALDQDVEIPFALYQSKIAPTEMGLALANDVRFTHDGMTRNEAVQFEKEFQGRVRTELAAQEQNSAQHDADLSLAISEYKDELARVGIKGKDADAQLQLLSSGANVAAARWSAIKGEAVSPAQWLRDVRGLQIRAVEQGQAQQKADLEQGAEYSGADLSKPEQVSEAKRLWETMGTESPYFKWWFGDSKVVDEQGKPLVVYHGTSAKSIAAFDKDKTQDSLFWFTSDKAKIESGESGAAGASSILPVYLSAKKLAGWEEYDRLTIDQMIAEGYDGIKLDDDYVMFSPAQIKSVSNRGTFDAGDARILYQAAMRRTQATSIVDFARLVRESGALEYYDGIQAGDKLKEATGKPGLLVNVPYDFVQHLDNSRGQNADRVLSFVGDVIASADEIIPAGGPKRPGRGERFLAVKYSGGTGHVVVGEVLGGKRGDRFLPITAFDGPEARIREALKARREGHSAEATGDYVAEIRAILSQLDEDIVTPEAKSKPLPQGSRGSIAFTDQGTFISLFKRSANLSTLPHELGHLFVNDMETMVATGNAPESVQKDLDALKAYAGDLSTVVAQEKLARSFEAYLREGKAPSSELRPAFQRFAAWLTAIYRDIKSLLGPDGLSDEVRGVFDRMLASEDEISSAEAYYGAKETLEKVASDMLTDAEKKRISELRGTSHAAAFEKRVKRYVSAYLKALGGKKAIEQEARTEIEAKPVYAASDEAVSSGGLSYADVAQELGGTAMIPELNKRRPGLVRDNYTFNAQLQKKHEAAVAALRKSGKKDVQEQRSFLSDMFDDGLKNNTAWRIKSFLLYGTDPMGEHAGTQRADKTAKGYKPGTVGLDYDDAVYHFGKQGLEGVQVGLVKRGGVKIDALMQEWSLSSADEVLDALHFKVTGVREAFVSSGLKELNQVLPEFQQNRTVGVTLPETLALKHGFNSAEHLLMEILKSQNKGDAIKALMEQKLAAKEAELRGKLDGETIPGDEDVHSDEVLERLATEARALERQIYASAGAMVKVTKPINAASSREVARAVLDGMTLADARDYRRFAAAERRAGLEVVKAVKAQKWQEALAAKQREAINHALVLEAVKLREEVTKDLNAVRRFVKSKKMEGEHLEQILALVEKHGLGTKSMAPVNPAQLAPLTEFLTYAFGEEDRLFNPKDFYDETILGLPPTKYTQLKAGQYREIMLLLRDIAEHGSPAEFARLLTEEGRPAMQPEIEKLLERINKSSNETNLYDEGTLRDRLSVVEREFLAHLNMRADMLRRADGFTGPDVTGPWMSWHRKLLDGQRRKARMQRDVLEVKVETDLARLRFEARFKKQYGSRAAVLNGVAVPTSMVGVGRYSWTAEHIWCLFRNRGNEGNLRYITQGLGLTLDQVQALTSILTEDEQRAAEKEMGLINRHYDESTGIFKRIYNRAMPERVVPVPFDSLTAEGKVIRLSGWYYPFAVDRKMSKDLASTHDQDVLRQDPNLTTFRPGLQKSFTKSRTGAARPTSLTYGVFEKGIHDQIQFISLAPVVKDLDTLMHTMPLSQAWEKSFGEADYKETLAWIKNIYNPVTNDSNQFDGALNEFRMAGVIYALAANAKSAARQYSGFFSAAKNLGSPYWVIKGIAAMSKGKAQAILEGRIGSNMAQELVNKMDPLMEDRDRGGFNTEQKDLNRKLGSGVKVRIGDKIYTRRDIVEFSMGLIHAADAHVTYAVWMGAYLKATADTDVGGLDRNDVDAVKYAYEIVESSQVTTDDTARNQWQRDPVGWQKVFGSFMSEAFRKGSRMRTDFAGWRTGNKSTYQYGRDCFYDVLMPAMHNVAIGSLLVSVAPDDWKDYFWSIWGETFGLIPLGNIPASFGQYGSRPGQTPAMIVMELGLGTAKSVFNLAKDSGDEKNQGNMIKSLIDFTALGVGSGNVRRLYQTFAEGWQDMAEGETKNPFRLFIKKPKGH